MRTTNTQLSWVALTSAAMIAAVAQGQGPGTPNYWLPADAVYDDFNGAVWSVGFVPSFDFDEAAVITTNNNAQNPVARINSNLTIRPGAVYLGEMAGHSGTLIIESGGLLELGHQPDNSTLAGVNVGLDGVGFLEVLPGATLNGSYITLGGEGGSVATFGGTAAGTTTVNLESSSGNDAGEIGTTVRAGNTLRVVGPNVDYLTLSLTVDDGGSFAAGITGATHSAIESINAVGVDGTLLLEFDGVSPTAGDRWNLFDAPGVNGTFDSISATGVPSLPLGQVFVFDTSADGSSARGMYGHVTLEQQLVLKVDRKTGALAIQNGPAAEEFDGYSISSALGALDTSAWNSLDDQGLSDWRESPASGSNERISELKPTGSTTVLEGPGLDLGQVFTPPTPTEFGTELEDLVFEYFKPDGSVVEAMVVYEGDKRYNNLVLVVDPDDGRAQLFNQSPFAVSIDGYWVESESGSLQPGAADWNSLDDQNADGGAWTEANPSENSLFELRADGSTLLQPGAVYNLGALFDESGEEDLVLRYLFPEDEQFTRVGAVAYRDIVGSLNGDYNDDGVVDAADYTVWRDASGSNVSPGTGADGNGDGTVDSLDYDVWQFNYGSFLAGNSGLAQVPEPASAATALALFAATAVAGRRRS